MAAERNRSRNRPKQCARCGVSPRRAGNAGNRRGAARGVAADGQPARRKLPSSSHPPTPSPASLRPAPHGFGTASPRSYSSAYTLRHVTFV